jgi:hypothetical protein
MECKKPITLKAGGITVGCGQCLQCLINKRREWTSRIILESKNHDKNSFVTLTYNPENLPTGETLVPSDIQLFIKRLRKRYKNNAIRYYLVGEYGDTTSRPHYHLALFGYPSCSYGNTQYKLGVNNCCKACDLLRDTWKKGNIDNGTLTLDSAQYIAGYVTKKMTKHDDPRLGGRYPEFARMSLKPAIGAYSVDALSNVANGKYKHRLVDVPKSIKHGGKSYPIGRTITEKLKATRWEKSKYTGWKYDEKLLQTKFEKAQEKNLRTLQEFEKANTSAQSLAEYEQQKRKQKALNREAKHIIYNNRKL